MLSPAALLALPACLRCQLHQVIFQSRHRVLSATGPVAAAQRCRTFHHSSRRLQEYEEFQADGDHEPVDKSRKSQRDYKYRHVYRGRISGKPGQRQREISQPLSIPSMDAPTEIVMFEDLPKEYQSTKRFERDQPKDQPAASSEPVLSAKDIEEAISAESKPAKQSEVDASIETLRPDNTVLEEADYRNLISRLTKAYNAAQLIAYLERSLKRRSVRSKEHQEQEQHIATVSEWKAGRSPIHERVAMPRIKGPKVQRHGTKLETAHRLLRLVWDVVIHSEEQAIGEVEMKLESWQVACLFDLTVSERLDSTIDERPMYHTFLTSKILLRASEIRPYRPDNIVRITARRQDAEEIIRLLQLGLLGFERLVFSARSFAPLLGGPDDSQTIDRTFNDQDLRLISSKTGSLLMREDNSDIAIYSRSSQDRHTARRLLLSLLHVPSHQSDSTLLPITGSRTPDRKFWQHDLTMLPVRVNGEHLRLGRNRWYRLTRPLENYVEPLTSYRERINDNRVVKRYGTLDRAKSLSKNSLPNTKRLQEAVDHTWGIHKSFNLEANKHHWQLPRISSRSSLLEAARRHDLNKGACWQATVGRLVYSIRDELSGRTKQQKTINLVPFTGSYTLSALTHHIPALDMLLPYLKPDRSAFPGLSPDEEVHQPHPYLTAHLIPFAVNNTTNTQMLATYPRLALTFLVNSPRDLKFTNLSFSFADHVVRNPLPDKAVDLQLERHSTMNFTPDQALKDRSIKAFVEALQRSAQEPGSLQAPSSVVLKLPSDQAQDDAAKAKGNKLTEVQYLFERYEQTETLDLVPNLKALDQLDGIDPEAAGLFNNMSRCRLRRIEVDGGEFGGRRVEYSVLEGVENVTEHEKRMIRERQEARERQDPSKAQEARKRQEAWKKQQMNRDDKTRETTKEDETRKEWEKIQLAEVVKAAFSFAELVSRANEGTFARENGNIRSKPEVELRGFSQRQRRYEREEDVRDDTQ